MNAPEPWPTDGKLPVVFDLDGTLAEATWPSNHVGEPIQDGVELMLEYSSRGYAILIHTARPPSHEERIWRWLDELGLGNVVFNVVCGKPLGCMYVDDRSFRPDYCDDVPGTEPEPPTRPVVDTREEPIEENDAQWEPDTDEGDRPDGWDDPELWTPVG